MTRQPIFARISRTATQAALGIVVAFAAYPAMAGAAAPQQAAPTPEQLEQKICVKTSLTGTRIAKMVCRTRGEFIALDGVDPLAAK